MPWREWGKDVCCWNRAELIYWKLRRHLTQSENQLKVCKAIMYLILVCLTNGVFWVFVSKWSIPVAVSTVEGLLNCHGAVRAQIVWSFLALLLFTENCLCSYLKHSWINFEFPENELLEFYCCAVTVTCVFISFFLAIFAIRFQWRSIFWVFCTRLLLQTVIHENHRTTRSLLLEELSTKTSLNLAVFCFIYGVEKSYLLDVWCVFWMSWSWFENAFWKDANRFKSNLT